MTVDVNFGALVKSVSIDNLLQQRDSMLQRIGAAIDLLKEAEKIAEASGIADGERYRGFTFILQGPDRYRDSCLMDKDATEQVRKRLDANAWNHLMHESGIRTIMDAKAREDWQSRIDKLECPPLTAENIKATFGDLFASRGDIFERGVISSFKALSWDYKTNRPFRFGKRIIRQYLRNSVSGKGSGLGFPNSRACDELDDLIRVFHVLDRKPEPDHRQGVYALLSNAAVRNEQNVETAYLHIRSFRNGNGHITFKRLDLVEKMNRILAKHFPGALAHDPHVDDGVPA